MTLWWNQYYGTRVPKQFFLSSRDKLYGALYGYFTFNFMLVIFFKYDDIAYNVVTLWRNQYYGTRIPKQVFLFSRDKKPFQAAFWVLTVLEWVSLSLELRIDASEVSGSLQVIFRVDFGWNKMQVCRSWYNSSSAAIDMDSIISH